MKYSYRGFEVAAPGFDRSKVDPKIFHKTYQASGLALLLRFEKSKPHAQYFQLYNPKRGSLVESAQDLRDYSRRVYRTVKRWLRNSFYTIAPRLVEYEADNGVDSDYSLVLLPW